MRKKIEFSEIIFKKIEKGVVFYEENTVFYTNPYTYVQYRLCHAHKNE